MKKLLLAASLSAGLFIADDSISAATVQTLGAGSAVSSIDFVATFDSLTATNTMELGNYTEGGLSITTGSQAWGADPNIVLTALYPFGGTVTPVAFYGIANGAPEWVTIQTTSQALMYGVELMYGNTWSIYGTSWGNYEGYLVWQTLKNGAVVSSGQVGPNPILPLGSTVGLFDPTGFDQLQVKCLIANSIPPNDQALALGSVQVQLTNRPPAPVIWGSDFSLDPATRVPALTVYDTIAGCQYRLVYSESLPPPAWNAVSPPLPDGWQPGGGTLTFTDPGAAGRPRRFYCVQVR